MAKINKKCPLAASALAAIPIGLLWSADIFIKFIMQRKEKWLAANICNR